MAEGDFTFADLLSGVKKIHIKNSENIPEYGWVDGDIEPTPIGFAFGAKIDPATGSIKTMYWNGSAWVEVV